LQATDILNHSQYGCRKGHFAQIALAHLDALIHNANSINSSLHSVFVDLQHAFSGVYHIRYPQTRSTRPPTSAPTKLLGVTHPPSQSSRSPLIYSSPGQWHSTGFTFEWYPFPHCHKRYFSAIPHPIIPILFTDDLSFHLNLIIKDGHMEFCKSQSILSPFGSPNLSSAYLPPNHPS